MGVLKIHCDYCGGSWELYSRQIHDPQGNQCPHCSSRIDRQTWEHQILRAFGALDDANRELFKDHIGNHIPLFQVDYTADNIFNSAAQPQKDEE